MANVKTFLLAEDGLIPNHPRFPLLLYPQVFPAPVTASAVQDRFAANGWGHSWVNGVYDYHHFHSVTHEVLGCFAGEAEVLFGGDNGVQLTFRAGDCILIPAGVGHKKISSSQDFAVVGAYPGTSSPDLCRGGEDPAQIRRRIAETPRPSSDPVTGESGPVFDEWPL